MPQADTHRTSVSGNRTFSQGCRLYFSSVAIFLEQYAEIHTVFGFKDVLDKFHRDREVRPHELDRFTEIVATTTSKALLAAERRTCSLLTELRTLQTKYDQAIGVSVL